MEYETIKKYVIATIRYDYDTNTHTLVKHEFGITFDSEAEAIQYIIDSKEIDTEFLILTTVMISRKHNT